MLGLLIIVQYLMYYSVKLVYSAINISCDYRVAQIYYNDDYFGKENNVLLVTADI